MVSPAHKRRIIGEGILTVLRLMTVVVVLEIVGSLRWCRLKGMLRSRVAIIVVGGHFEDEVVE
ncbi:hypothetical protein TMatcc_002556 [Talaromyces marneffei ATCC 18224]